MKKGEQTRSLLVDATARLLQTQGYTATSVNEILAESGAPRGSFYFHFPEGKEQLACEALKSAGGKWRGKILAAAESVDNPAEAIGAVCNVLADALVESDYADGCPLATVVLEAAATCDPIQDVCSTHFAGWQAVIAERLGDAGVPEASRSSVATLVLSAVEGAQMLCRAHRSPEPLRQVGAMLTMMVKALPALRA